MKKIMFSILTLACVLSAVEMFTVITEEFPPYNFTKGGKVTGVSTEIVEAVFKGAGIPYEIRVYPWARAIKEVQIIKNTALYSTGRRPDRETLFKWVGELIFPKYSVFALKSRSDITAKSLEDLKKYKIGTTKGDARENYLLTKGFEIGVNIEPVTGIEANVQNFKKLEINRIDLWPMPDAVADFIVTGLGKNPDLILKSVIPLDEVSKTGYFLALNKETPDEVVKKLQTSLDKLKADGTVKKILSKWKIR